MVTPTKKAKTVAQGSFYVKDTKRAQMGKSSERVCRRAMGVLNSQSPYILLPPPRLPFQQMLGQPPGAVDEDMGTNLGVDNTLRVLGMKFGIPRPIPDGRLYRHCYTVVVGIRGHD